MTPRLLGRLLWGTLPGLCLAAEPPSTAEYCGRCHRAIHEAWKQSAHARAMESRLFQDALELAEQDFGPQSRKLCLGCHAPVAVRTGDLALRQKVSWEGVTCEYCHSMREVVLAAGNPRARIEFSPVKSGPLKDAVSGEHGVEYSPLHTSALACAPCHEYNNALGFPVLTTFSEWRATQAGAAGQPCQACHMDRVAGEVVDPRIRRAREARVNLHLMPGSHSIEQLTRTITARLSAVREGDQLKVTVEVANRLAGHRVPTGSPLRQLQLTVSLESYDGRRLQDQRIYRRLAADAQGRPLTLEHLVFVKAAKLVSDTRLGAGERRTEVFLFALPAGAPATVKASLTYYYSPMARQENQQRLTFLSLRRLVR